MPWYYYTAMEPKPVEKISKRAESALLNVIVLALPVLFIFGAEIIKRTSAHPTPILVPTATATLVPELARQVASTPADMLPALVFGIVCIVLPTAIVLARVMHENRG